MACSSASTRGAVLPQSLRALLFNVIGLTATLPRLHTIVSLTPQ